MKARFAKLRTDQGLRAKSIRSAFWTMTGFGGQSALRLASNLILTRILAPDMFGLMALATVFLTGLSLMSDLGTRQSIVRSKRGEDPGFLATAWTIQVLRGFGIAAVACVLAWPMAQLYGQPDLFLVLCVLSLTAVIGGFMSVSMATASRNMALAAQTAINLISQVITVVAMVVAAYYLENVWALVIGAVLGNVLRVGLSHLLMPPFRHRFRWERAALTEIITFGRWVLLGTMFTFLGGRGITAVHGALVDLELLGILAVSTLLIAAAEDLVHRLQTAVGFPAFAETVRKDPKRLPEILTKVRNRLVLSAVALFVLLVFIAQPVIDLLYDERYALAGAFLALQALNGALRVLSDAISERDDGPG